MRFNKEISNRYGLVIIIYHFCTNSKRLNGKRLHLYSGIGKAFNRWLLKQYTCEHQCILIFAALQFRERQNYRELIALWHCMLVFNITVNNVVFYIFEPSMYYAKCIIICFDNVKSTLIWKSNRTCTLYHTQALSRIQIFIRHFDQQIFRSISTCSHKITN